MAEANSTTCGASGARETESSIRATNNETASSSDGNQEELYEQPQYQHYGADQRSYNDKDFEDHNYEYTRTIENPVLQPMSRQISRHDSALTAIARLRSRKTETAEPFAHPLSQQKTGPEMIVDFDSKDDPYRPLNWAFRKKVITTLLYGLTTMGITFASSVFSAGLSQISREFNVSTEVATLGISLMLLGFGLGPLIWAPLSETFGRKQAVLTPFFIAAIFSFGTASAKDIQTIMITRFFAGFFGSAPITNTGGVLGDIWSPQTRAFAVVGYALAVVGGPSLGPLVGGVIVIKNPVTGWRWTEYTTGIYCMVILTLDVMFLDESFAPTLLTYKARRLRIETGNWALHSRHEEWDVSLKELSRKYLVRPFQMMATPICFLIAVYASFVYAILYGNLSAFAIAFQEERGWNPVQGGLPFLALLVGILLGACLVLWNAKYYTRAFNSNGQRAVPEARLPSMEVGGVVFVCGMFVFGWTSDPSLHWSGQIVGCAMIGFGFFTIFQAAINYLVDTFQRYGASAIAANTFLRSVFAAAFPLFINPMYHNLGVNWASTVFALIGVLLIPIPFLFAAFGKRIRARGVWSKESV